MKFIQTWVAIFLIVQCQAQQTANSLSTSWQFRQTGSKTWHHANVPGNVYSDLFNNKLIPDPLFGDQEYRCYWIDSTGWEYRTIFDVDSATYSQQHIELVFDGIDTYAAVYLNGKEILVADNMFRQWAVNIKPLLARKKNELFLRFRPALMVTDSIAYSKKPLVLPDNNRVYARKAQFQFGWDWGPRFINAGIWKPVWIDAYQKISRRQKLQNQRDEAYRNRTHKVGLVRKADSIGTTFYFSRDDQPVYAKGANWIPAHIFLSEVKKKDYRRLLQLARDAHMNMLRVWGGGIYENDEFYDICDELGIMVWQDFMFAGGMYPGDAGFMENVKEEVRQQVMRLRHHSCIVLWCGNNEVDEAWKNWGWQKQFNIHGNDSLRLYTDYKNLFEDSLRRWVNEWDGTRPYVPTSPMHGWGRKESLLEGDSHYWGLWWGLEDWEIFLRKTGRFVSEYGMQALPNKRTIESFTSADDQHLSSTAIRSHQKAADGFLKLNHYLSRYMIDSSRIKTLSLDEYRYLTQCLQYYILENSIAVHRSKAPYNMGTLLWQLNDCWPVTSWSIIDSRQTPKAAWYAVKNAYRDDIVNKPDATPPRNWMLPKPSFDIQLMGKNKLMVRASTDACFIELSVPGKEVFFEDNYFHLRKDESRLISVRGINLSTTDVQRILIRSYYDVLNK